MHLTVITTDFIVLGSAKAISDLSDKRSNIYADRVRYLTTVKHDVWADDTDLANNSDA